MRTLNNHLKTLLLMAALTGLLLYVGKLLGPGGFYGSVLLALVLNLGTYFFADRIVLRMHGAKVLDEHEAPRLHRMVQELSQRAGIPKPRIALIEAPYANAFATGRNPKNGVVAVTSGIMSILTERELRGVLAHEIAHIRNRDILVATVAAALAGALGYIAHALAWAPFFGRSDDEEGSHPAVMLIGAIVSPLAATLIQLAVSRSREYLADASGAEFSDDPEALASALEKLSAASTMQPAEVAPATASLFIVNPLAGASRVASLFSTHPPMEERVRRLRQLAGGPIQFA